MATIDYSSTDFQNAVSAVVEAKTYNWILDINTSFLLTSGYLVFMMQLGFALVSSVQTCALSRLQSAAPIAARALDPLAQLSIIKHAGFVCNRHAI